ncbi:Zinc uptake regulation protein [Austwickia sp. TVS 96-490-7B]|uniref:Fur family transcriptional regulator n=1 Tax=Austwickia sp. TVS 96-490-7B TaxID=2830843 RepID=UPI001C58917C|nr:Fur family transcriptional regulator [Austwickia sp. TVS 96-490-7B]MBW3084808.1 Zinc uptake regulation protein [Austwickia sp. TVS 96-490-7B]
MAQGERRATRQRRAVEEALAATADFVSAQVLHSRLRSAGDTIGLATVYRALACLVEEGRADMIRRHDGEAIYRLCSTDEHHHHLVCRDCGKTVEVEAPQDEKWAGELAHQHGFSDIWHTLEIFGTCSTCHETHH